MKNIQQKGNKIRVFFSMADDQAQTEMENERKLYGKPGLEELFYVAQNGKRLSALAEVKDDYVELTLSKCDKRMPLEISFANEPYVEMKLFNRAGLSAFPFSPVKLETSVIKTAQQ